MLTGEQVNVTDMMICRDRRAEIQRNYIAKHNLPVLSFALNIPGPVKTNEQIHACFAEALNSILKVLEDKHIPILEYVIYNDKTGDELLLCFNGNPTEIKEAMALLEEKTPLGRLYDIDIIDVNGEKLSRQSYRKCLICQCQAQECARSRTHTIEEMQNKIISMLEEAGY